MSDGPSNLRTFGPYATSVAGVRVVSQVGEAVVSMPAGVKALEITVTCDQGNGTGFHTVLPLQTALALYQALQVVLTGVERPLR